MQYKVLKICKYFFIPITIYLFFRTYLILNEVDMGLFRMEINYLTGAKMAFPEKKVISRLLPIIKRIRASQSPLLPIRPVNR